VTDAELRNALKYAALALASFLVGCCTALLPQLLDPTMPDLNYRAVLAAGITAVVTAYGGSFLPRSGATAIAAQVDSLKAQGIPHRDMVVLPKEGAIAAVTADPVQVAADNVMALDAKQRVRLEEEVERRHADMVAEQRPPTTAEVADQVAGIIDRSEREGGKG
jgi:hypothetical protein